MGFLLVVLGLGVGLLAADLPIPNVAPGPVELSLLGHPLASVSGRIVVGLLLVLAAVTGAVITAGILRWLRVIDGGKHREGLSKANARLEATNALLRQETWVLERSLDDLLTHRDELQHGQVESPVDIREAVSDGCLALYEIAEQLVALPDLEAPRMTA